MREANDLSQEALAQLLGTNQNAISRLESPRYGKPTITTLKKLASAFDVGLVVRFVPFTQLVKWVAGVPQVDRGLSWDSLCVPGFEAPEQQRELDLLVDESMTYGHTTSTPLQQDVTEVRQAVRQYGATVIDIGSVKPFANAKPQRMSVIVGNSYQAQAGVK